MRGYAARSRIRSTAPFVGWLADDVTDDFSFATLDLDDESDGNTARVDGWLDAIMRGFHQARPNDEFRTKWLASQRADGAVNRGVWESDALPLSSDVPVATFGHVVKSLNAGAATLPAWMITDVTVAPTHRRRGLMRRLMTENLADAVAAHVPVAVLTASEGAIYQRFGFGAATREARVRVDTSSRFRLRARPDDGGRVVIVDGEESWPMLSTVFARHHEVTRGALGRPRYYELGLKGFDWDEMSEDRKQRIAVRLSPGGEPDGFVAYAMKESDGAGEVEVRDIVTSTPAAHLALWQFLADIDLAEVVDGACSRDRPPDARAGRPPRPSSHRHARPPVGTHPGRAWRLWRRGRGSHEGALTVRVLDDLGHADGTVRIEVTGGRATVAASVEQPDVTLDVETLGTLYLGDVPVDALARAGRIHGTDDAVRRFAALADGSPSPHCNTHF